MFESTPYELSPDANGDEASGDYSPPVKALTDSRVAALCANAAYRAFLRYEAEFHIIIRRAADRFLFRNWPGAYGDAAERLGLYDRVLDQLLKEIHELMGNRLEEKPLWAASKRFQFSVVSSQWAKESG